MSENKKVKKTETDKEKIAKARKKRLALAAERNVEKTEAKSDEREEFRKYFLKINKQLKLDKSIEHVIWTHLKTIGCDKKELFEKGVNHFGYKI